MSKIIIILIGFYQKYLSFDTGVFSFKKGTTCVFYPTCSEYTKQAVSKYGAFKGLYLGIRRILRCHPWQKNHIDPLL
ncbi:MAG: membrane protein insertion efficiency factor YidD [Candidatus Yonathbacteria bacterium RIFCSPHIGHO2_01_FULL_44_41]|uniref:Putative membrane protein insertion efficiency factor n=1 Tax=Candidatus Yonathbacteria bacterium RIFCSPHIGHO2_02_FULL_44_14 TaxID=1802724 RepID=A0A1G2S5N8_9BACT|nr:MAG: membrane protein insertion efficiency factor YidD [Candidatus Yonathbacteria bacterium RIFCSPHIGHO2_01_FULL_44_41]OHA80434.1 MAG: membrane protein insertion efficiency factor YidD [Candidatus Yonathbacteria bacterium RIFCSPHIGHO2_02_FULL_44_14]OHA81688.1 MAG: membrane protein insertion efficiency factor YidD [Candidatus Yonathbacteria bacterium RIFCSPLOWO2_01_FULL_43_20]